MPRDGTLLLYRVPDKGADLLAKAIRFFTGKPYSHAALFCYGATWEENEKGANRTPGLKQASEYWEPDVSMTSEELERGKIFLWVTTGMGIRHRWPYNFLLTFIEFIVYPTRWFWNKIGWVPFAGHLLGANCSAYCDLFWRYSGRDIRSQWLEMLSAPGDLVGLPGFHRWIP